VKRNTVVLGVTLALLALFAWAGWANWMRRQQQAEQLLANAAKGTLVPNTQGGAPHYSTPLEGKPAPAFALEDLSGHKVRLEDFRGKAVLLNFWATWCGPCKIETPWLVELRNKYAAEGFEVIGISTEGEDLKPGDKAGLERQRDGVKKFVAEMKVPYPMLLGGDALSQPYGGLDAMPTSFYLDRNGVVVAAQMGLSSAAEMEANIHKALGK
jgi:cytochrome c biogenesis protein CcmG/thiol:disulfide interchange protein DsbE